MQRKNFKPLTSAVLENNKAEVELLLKEKVDTNVEQPWMLAKMLGYQSISNILPPAYNQLFLTRLIRMLGYHVSKEGVCFGLGHMAKHAIMTRQVNVFNTRLTMLMKLYFDAEDLVIKQLSLKRPIHEKDQSKTFKKRLKIEIHSAIHSLRHSNTNDKQIYTDILAFCDGIYLYQQHPNFRKIYPDINFPCCNAAAQQTQNIIMPDAITIEYRGHFSGVYSVESLNTYLKLFSNGINQLQFEHPVTIIFMSNDHACTIGYDTADHSWYIANAEELPVTKIESTHSLVEKTFDGFNTDECCILISSIYGSKTDRDQMTALLHVLLDNAEWREIHKVTDMKIGMRAGKDKKYKWETIASGRELTEIQKVQASQQNTFCKVLSYIPRHIANHTHSLFKKMTIGKYERAIDDNDKLVPVYQKM